MRRGRTEGTLGFRDLKVVGEQGWGLDQRTKTTHRHLVCIRYYCEHFTHIYSFNPHNSPCHPTNSSPPLLPPPYHLLSNSQTLTTVEIRYNCGHFDFFPLSRVLHGLILFLPSLCGCGNPFGSSCEVCFPLKDSPINRSQCSPHCVSQPEGTSHFLLLSLNKWNTLS